MPDPSPKQSRLFEHSRPKARQERLFDPLPDKQDRTWVHHADCREFMASMDADSVHLILTDPPYFIDGMDDGWDWEKLWQQVENDDRTNRPGGGKSFREMDKLREFMSPVAVEWFRIMAPGAWLVSFTNSRLLPHMAIAFEEAGFITREIMAWLRGGHPKARNFDSIIAEMDEPEEVKEEIRESMQGRKNFQINTEIELMVVAQKPMDGKYIEHWQKWKTGLVDVMNPVISGPGGFPSTLIPCPKVRGWQRRGHLTPKPPHLMRHLVRLFTLPGQLVFDPFSGSGSTGVGARVEGRDFVGCEKEEEMARIADARVHDKEY